MSVRLIVCGSAGTHPGPGRVCSSYLVTADGTDLLLDAGNGSLANLQTVRDVADLDAVVLSHLHPDHCADMYGLYYARRFHRREQPPLPVHAPAGAADRLAALLADDGPDAFNPWCAFVDLTAGDAFAVGGLDVAAFRVRHPGTAFGVRVAAGGRVLAYTGDAALTAELVAAVAGADLLVADATWLERDRPLLSGIHMTGLEAGRLAAQARVGRLLVTHVKPSNDPAEVAAEAARAFDGQIIVAADRMELTL
ncbi:MBL fold metallo-hydrolase [soil metagenome]